MSFVLVGFDNRDEKHGGLVFGPFSNEIKSAGAALSVHVESVHYLSREIGAAWRSKSSR